MKKKEVPSLHEELGPLAIPALQGIIQANAEKYPVTDRFTFTEDDGPAMIITDNTTGRKSKVGLYAYSSVRKVLNDLFGHE